MTGNCVEQEHAHALRLRAANHGLPDRQKDRLHAGDPGGEAGLERGHDRGFVLALAPLGLLALAGDTVPIRERMGELTARVRAIEEISLA